MKKWLLWWILAYFACINLAYTSTDGQVRLVNDTAQGLYIWADEKPTWLPAKDGKKSVKCEVGKKIYESNGKKRGSLILIIDQKMCNKTLKLSAYL